MQEQHNCNISINYNMCAVLTQTTECWLSRLVTILASAESKYESIIIKFQYTLPPAPSQT